MIKLKEKYSKEIQEIIFDNIKSKAEQNKYECNTTTMCNPNIISLANGELEKTLEEDFISRIESMKRLEYGIAAL